MARYQQLVDMYSNYMYVQVDKLATANHLKMHAASIRNNIQTLT